MLLLPTVDPLQKKAFGATDREPEAIVSYQEAMKRIRPVFHTDDSHADYGKEKTEKEKKGKGKGKGEE